MLAGSRKLDNLVVIVDNNNLQIDGTIEEVNSPYPIDKKFEAFNFHVITINGNEVSPSIKETITTSDFNSLKREATGWVTLNATVDFSTKKVTYTLKKGETTVVESTTADFVNKDTTVLDRVFIAAGKYCGGVLMDNLKIEAVQ